MKKRSLAQRVAVSNKTKWRIRRSQYDKIKNAVFSPRYELSVAFVTPQRMAYVNKLYRNKKEPTDILSFEVGPQIGEILICPTEAAKKAPLFGDKPEKYLQRLFIHGISHLKGFTHGVTMDSFERRLMKRFFDEK